MEGSSVRKLKTICVFCGARPGKGEGYISAANALGLELGRRNIGLVYGGGSLGLMGSIAGAVCSGGGSFLGIVPQDLANLIGKTPGKEVRVSTVHDRIMKIHQKPIGILNVNGFFNSLFTFLDHAVEQKFLSPEARKLLISASTAEELIDKLEDFHHVTDLAASQLKWEVKSSKE